MIFLSEIKMKDHRIDGVQRRMWFPYGFNVGHIGKSGGLSLWWDTQLEVEIDARVRTLGKTCWRRLTEVYGTAYRAEKLDFWWWMGAHIRPSHLPWLWAGDFNKYIWDSEKSGGSDVLYNRP